MLQRTPAVELITQEHYLKGALHTRGQRFLDVLNDRRSDYLQIADAQIFRISDLSTPIAAITSVVIRKTDIRLAVITEDIHEAPEARLYGFVKKERHRAFLSIGGYEADGQIHLTDLNGVTTVLNRERGDFFPVTDVVVTSAVDGRKILKGSVAMVNKAHVSLFCAEPVAGE